MKILKLSYLTLSQRTFFETLNTNIFKNKVLERQNTMGLKGAFFFSMCEMQSETKNYSFDNLTGKQQKEFISALIVELPELESLILSL